MKLYVEEQPTIKRSLNAKLVTAPSDWQVLVVVAGFFCSVGFFCTPIIHYSIYLPILFFVLFRVRLIHLYRCHSSYCLVAKCVRERSILQNVLRPFCVDFTVAWVCIFLSSDTISFSAGILANSYLELRGIGRGQSVCDATWYHQGCL